jgi:integrase
VWNPPVARDAEITRVLIVAAILWMSDHATLCDRVIIRILLESGARLHEILGLTAGGYRNGRSLHVGVSAFVRKHLARDAGLVKTNPTAKLKPIASQPLAPRGFTSVERQRLRSEAERAGPMPDAIVTTLLNTGLRVDELIHLTWDDVTLLPRSGKAAIRKGKGDKPRTVPLNMLVRDALNGVRPALVEGPIFRGRRGPYTDRGIRNLLAVLGRRANVTHVHPNRFRHDAARRLIEAVDLPTVAALLGHSRLDTVRIYAQPDEAALERAVAALESR